MKTEAQEYILYLEEGGDVDKHRQPFGSYEECIKAVEEVCLDLKSKLNGNYAQSPARRKKSIRDLQTKHPLIKEVQEKKKTARNKKEKTENSNQEDVGKDYIIYMPELPERALLKTDYKFTWLEEHYVKYSTKYSPESFPGYHPFCGIMLLSIVAARRLVLPQAGKKMTNLYLFLAGKSSLYKKTTAMEAVRQTLYQLNLLPLVFEEPSITASKLVSNMSRTLPKNYEDLSHDAQEDIKSRLPFAGQKCGVYDEAGKFLQSVYKGGDSIHSSMQPLLLSMMSTGTPIVNDTFDRGKESVSNPYLCLLGGCVPQDLAKVLKKGADAWHDGLCARSIFVCASGRHINNTQKIRYVPAPDEVTQPLLDWHKRLGIPEVYVNEEPTDKGGRKYEIRVEKELPEHECSMADDAFEAYARYRESLRDIIYDQRQYFPDDLAPSYDRLSDTCLKFAMLIASFESPQNHITLEYYAKAQELTELLRYYIHMFYTQVTEGQPKTTQRAIEDDIISALEDRGAKSEEKAITFKLFLNRSRKLQHYGTTQIMQCLTELGRVEKVGVIAGKGEKAKYYLITDD